MDLSKIKRATGRLGKIVAMRLPPGADIIETIEAVAEAEGIQYGVVLSGAALVRKITLRNLRTLPEQFPVKDEHRVYTSVEAPLEVLSLTGNISRLDDGRIWVHCHATVSSGKPDTVAYGGHLVKGAVIGSTGEIVIAEVEGCRLLRRTNEETKILEIYPTND